MSTPGNITIDDLPYFCDTPRFLNATAHRHRRGNDIVDPNLNPKQPYIICRPVRITNGEYYYQAVPELPIAHSIGTCAKYPIRLGKEQYFKVNKRWLVAWYPQLTIIMPFNPSSYLFSIWKKELEQAMRSRL